MEVVVHLAPRFDLRAAEALARELYGLEARAEPLPSERDQNFKLTRPDGARFVLKIANAAEDPGVLDLQHQALARAAAAGLAVPRALPARDGRTIAVAPGPSGRVHHVRLFTWVDGVELARVRPHDETLLRSLGRRVAQLDRALEGLEHPAMHRPLAWDLAQARWIAGERDRIEPADLRERVARAAERFERVVAPALARLRAGVIHNDWNDWNALVSPAIDAPREVVGVVDFGDVVWSRLVCDVAIAAAYASLGKPDPLAAAAAVVAGYHEVLPLEEEEIALLFDLIELRLCVSVAMAARQRAAAPENAYLQVSQADAAAALRLFATVPREWAHVRFRAACGLEPFPRARAIRAWLASARAAVAPVLGRPIDPDRLLVLDLSAGSLEVGDLDEARDPDRFTRRLAARLAEAGAEVAAGRYDEARVVYEGERFAQQGNDGQVLRTVHLGVDLFVPAGTPVHAPIDGVVHSLADNRAPRDYGPTIVLVHPTGGPAGEVYTLYGHLARDSLARWRPGDRVRRGEPIGAVGSTAENGGWAPHLHLQVVGDMLGYSGDFPGVAAPEERDAWLSLCPDPTPLLGLDEGTLKGPRTDAAALLARRRDAIGPSVRLSYRRPLLLVRGHRQFLYDHEGRRYLDAVNNVPHVGHSHPRVVEAVTAQLAVLTTNTRYLHENLVRYAERLAARLPPPLRVFYLVNSGSEANELALRLARAHTGRRDVLVLDGAYHGNTSTLVEMSPYKFNGPGGRGAPPWVHVAPMPDPFRGVHRGPEAGPAYVESLRQAIAGARARGREIAAFFCEPVMSCAGQIVPPPGFLAGAAAAAREAGALVVCDEVQIGFGRLGDWFWGFESQGVVPDVVTMGKPAGNGFPLGVVVTTREIAASFDNGMEYFNTFGGSPVACAAGLAVLDVIEEEDLQSRARDVGAYLLGRLRELASRFPIVGDARGLGLFLGIELAEAGDRHILRPATRQARYVVDRLRERGVLVSTDGPDDNVVKIKPPLVFDRRDADELVEALEVVLTEDPAQPA